MRLTAKFLLAITAVVATTLCVSAWLTIKRESELFDRDLRHDTYAIGWLLARTYQRTAQHDGLAAAAATLEDSLLARSGLAARWLSWRDVPAAARDELGAGRLYAARTEGPGDGTFDAYVPAALPGRPGALHLQASLRAERRYLRATIWRWTVTSLALLCAASLAVLALGIRLIARPTRALVDKARRIGGGDLGGPVTLRQRDELGLLGDELNAMTDQLAGAQERVHQESAARLSAVEQLRHADRLTTVGKLASGIAHELGTPLNVIEGRARMIQTGDAQGDEVEDSARIVVEQTRRVTAIVRQLLDFARRGRSERVAADVRPILGSARSLLLATARAADVALEVELGEEPCRASVNDGQLLQVLTNLVVNAVQATPRGGAVTLAAAATTATPPRAAAPQAVVAITVRDTGPGIPPELRDRIFEPFFTTKDVGQGTGLGLAVVHGIVADHEGWIEVASSPGPGATFTVYLPQA
ncbi:MAG: ATP-binding protein [Kofleriaceae bacterium]